MRGADFERHLQRLDEEMSLAIFTPVLLMKTADVGSYNLGVGHMQMYLWMLNALNADRAQYIDRHILMPLSRYNSPGANPPKVHIKFNKLDNTNAQLIQMILQALIGRGEIKFDLNQLGEMAGLTIEQVKETLQPPAPNQPPGGEPGQGGQPPSQPPNRPGQNPAGLKHVQNEIIKRVTGQVTNAFREGKYGPELRINFGFKRTFEDCLAGMGVLDSTARTNRVYAKLDAWARDVTDLGTSYLTNAEEFKSRFVQVLEGEVEQVANAS
jgi:hypothetical protein